MAAKRKKNAEKGLSFGAREAYKLLRTNLVFSMAGEEGCRVIGMTSALRGEGKSTTTVNLATSLAQSGKRVLILEADMRIPVLASRLGLEGTPRGLSEVLAGLVPLKDAIYPVPSLRNVSLLPSGEIPPNPAELLGSKRMELILGALVSVYDYIFIDLPPVNAVADGLAISRLLAGMVVVVRQDYCDQRALAEAMRRMELLEVKVLGFVFNGADTAKKWNKRYGKNGYYKNSYAYEYKKSDAKTSDSAETFLTPDAAHGKASERSNVRDV